MQKLIYVMVTIATLSAGSMSAQEWEIEKAEKRAQEKQKESDSIIVHLSKRWEIGLSYGRWQFNNASKSDQDELFSFSGAMNVWQLTGSWHFSERMCADFAMGIHLKTNTPDPDVVSILNGDDIELEGFGVLLFPVDFGLRYYFTKRRLRPFLGIGAGVLPANARYTVAEGNINTGISRTDFQTRERAVFGKIKAGFDYRLGIKTNG